MVALDKIIQRSSSKSVKQTLAKFEELSKNDDAANREPAPRTEVEMLLALASDVYYRVVMKKCRGIEIFTKLAGVYPELEDSCKEIVAALTTLTMSCNPTSSASPCSTLSPPLVMGSKEIEHALRPPPMDDASKSSARLI